MIWLFPGASQPITSRNIIRCLSTAKATEKTHSCPGVKYFSSVPYVLEMLAEDKEALELLRGMDQVGVGGAALSPKIGDDLVRAGVNLLSRFGSAECGFLLSSHRKFETDKDWQYIRLQRGSQHLRFEEQNHGLGLSELVILKGWPHMAKVNREDGSFTTSDLFEPHPTIKYAWRYHSRSDSQITLKTGKKFDPAPLEDEIRNASSRIGDVMIFGNGKQSPGLLVHPSLESAESDLIDHVWEIVKNVSNRGQEHTRISKNMIVIIPSASEGFRKSSKGTTLRRQTQELYQQQISDLYPSENGIETNGVAENHVVLSDDEIRPIVKDAINANIAGEEELEERADFYHNGMDSSQCTRIRSQIEKVWLSSSFLAIADLTESPHITPLECRL